MDSFDPVFGDLDFTDYTKDETFSEEQGTLIVKVGTVRFGQTFDFIIKTDKFSDLVINYESNGNKMISKAVSEL